MEQTPEGDFEQILDRIDGSRRSWDGAATYQVGPFTLDPEYARPALGAAVFTESDVRELLRFANEDPPWASIGADLLVEWNKLEWIVERVPGLAPAVSNAGLSVSTNPLLIKRPDTDPRLPPAPNHAKIEVVDPDSDPRELIAAWRLLDPVGSAPTLTPRGALEQVRLAAAAVPGDEAARWVQNRTASGFREAVVRFRGTIVGAGMREPFVDVSEITDLAVLPPFRRRGFGTALAAALAADALDNGADLIFVESAPEATTMYERAGFQVIGAIGHATL